MAGSTGGQFGTSGTLTAVATITAALRDISVKKVGYSGVMMPVMEDTRLAQLWGEGALSMDQLLAYSAVCGTGLDTIPLPGDVTDAAARTHHRRRRHAFREIIEAAQRAPAAGCGRKSRRSDLVRRSESGEHGHSAFTVGTRCKIRSVVTQFELKSAHSAPECTGRNGLYKTLPPCRSGFVEAARFWGGQSFASFGAKLSHHRPFC